MADKECRDKCDACHTRHGFEMLGRRKLRGAIPSEDYLGFSFFWV